MISSFRFHLFCTLIAVAVSAGCALLPSELDEVRTPDRAFSADRAFSHVRYLSEEIGSRPASTGNSDQAAAYIADQFRSVGLDVERARFEYTLYEVREVELGVVQPISSGIKAFALMYSAAGDQTAGLVNAGDGKSQDFARMGVRGRIALMRRGDNPFGEKVSNATKAGAVGAVIYNNREGEFRGSMSEPSAIPAVAISDEEGRRLLNLLKESEVVVRLVVDAETALKQSENVVGSNRGRGEKILVLGAHYDSVEAGPGANDNASGVGTLVELANVMSTASYPFEVRFIAFGAEELGLIGSQKYVQSLSLAERQSTIAAINFDMVGVGDGLRFGGEAGLVRDAIAAAKEMEIDAQKLDEKLSNASDHASFMEVNIPALMVHWQDDPNFHTKDDKAEFVRPDRIEVAGKVALRLVDKLAKRKG